MPRDYYNKSHCADPTAYTALKHITEEQEQQEQIRELLRIFRSIARKRGFEIEGRISFKHKESGRIYK